ncbi:cell division protein ZapA [Alteribacillus sp. HJP-4]|uniref:cell division protein ZapA n=1 Tax=Alteribacillus sp. HJP-4 TaxID=2775394 RepID=UPI0035CCD500
MAGDNSKHRTTVTIYGQQYKIVSDESPRHVENVADYLDQKMREFKNYNPYLDTTSLAVLTAVNITDDYFKMKRKLELYEKEEREEE